MSGAMTSCGRCGMRHDPASAAVEVMLRSLKMYGMAQAVGELIEQGAPAFDAAGKVSGPAPIQRTDANRCSMRVSPGDKKVMV
jgi:hypothetical protein